MLNCLLLPDLSLWFHGRPHLTYCWPFITFCVVCTMGFSDSSVGKQSAYNAGDPSSTPGLGRSAAEGIGYPLQYSWTSLMTQLVKNPPTMRETWVQSLGWEDPLEKGKATHFSILAWRIPWAVHGVAKSQTWLSNWTTSIRLHPSRHHCPWDSPWKNTGFCSHSLL